MNRIQESIEQSIAVKQAILSNNALMQTVSDAAQLIEASLRAGGKIHFCGNGGSAADAQHLAAELSGRFYYDRPPLNAEALHCNSSYLTAVGNDYGYDEIFARLMRGTGHKGDILVGISTSGNSKNVYAAAVVGKALGLAVIGLTGKTGGKLKEISDICICAPETETYKIQELHLPIYHEICAQVEKHFFSDDCR